MQPHIQQNNDKKSGLFSYLLLLTAIFVALEISFFIQASQVYFGDFTVVASHLKIPGKIIPGIIYFVFVQIFLHILFVAFIWALTRLIGVVLRCPWSMIEKIGFGLWCLGIVTLLLANQYFFPNSKFSSLINFFINHRVSGVLLIVLSLGWCAVLATAIWGLISVNSYLATGILSLGVAIVVFSFYPPASAIEDASTTEKPNIILIGMDSLRPDFLGYFGYEKLSPHLDEFLDRSAVFSDAFTPLARTFPAWISILSGQYPKNNGVRFNLPELNSANGSFDWQNTLPNILQHQGYETIFATDETRFSNIDQRFGFDKVVTPPVGTNDFLLGNMNDFPMANLLVNTPVGKYLFPHSFGNRPVYTTYEPNSFLKMLAPTLGQPRNKPVFLAVHFCLPHYPYFWGNHSADQKTIRNYQASITRVDQQFHDFMRLLKKNKLLEHSIIVVLSDHGEAIGLPGDRVTEEDLFIRGADNKQNKIPHFYPASPDMDILNQSAGHGTDVLGLTQYHIVLAFRTYGLTKNETKTLPLKTSLLDIKPTVLDFIAYPRIKKDNGSSLKPIILGQEATVWPERDLFIESDFTPQAVRSVHPETRDLLFQGIDYFQIDPVSTRITVKKSMSELIISSKQYANIFGGWILALYPQSKTKMTPILVNLTTGQWTNDLRTPFAKNSPSVRMLQALKEFYGKEITHVENISA